MSETPAERARRRERQGRARNVYGVGATQLLARLRHLRAEALHTQTNDTQEG